MYKATLTICLSFCALVSAYDMIVGDTVHRKMVFHQRVKQFAIPLKKRVTTLTYNDPDKRIIKWDPDAHTDSDSGFVLDSNPGPTFHFDSSPVLNFDPVFALDSNPGLGIAVLDNDFSHASANVTEGGVGCSYATIRMKSQRSHPINYEVEIYM
ncbi:hypothetical protein EVAR_25659_1 [Eumeta japonica]|uniref:Uncharacterized protein n=1 Tax=Eumeta variegata TaxID=151549 RepID=A0A4C1WH37_EUMVA|nr:hypothetical protein EVAR_25659_1 [Eumeta japonica]